MEAEAASPAAVNTASWLRPPPDRGIIALLFDAAKSAKIARYHATKCMVKPWLGRDTLRAHYSALVADISNTKKVELKKQATGCGSSGGDAGGGADLGTKKSPHFPAGRVLCCLGFQVGW
eukprot:CAMPEP_0171629602 /NCGR_PEP_ID=MMETSP0990-20121206/22301_1 /TAXON_ID=483369 /ORGANISM="non described non described, Strain CCMP2098" /LENGTH=119 /DNA_ID=CAMNT_0012198351 /DNA_START=246 /DNA_END=602 /DNA_ORIENTATION=-